MPPTCCTSEILEKKINTKEPQTAFNPLPTDSTKQITLKASSRRALQY